jgi:hypothetical protein
MFVVVIRNIHHDEKSMRGVVGPFNTMEEGWAWLESMGFVLVHVNKYSKPGRGEYDEAYVADLKSPDDRKV